MFLLCAYPVLAPATESDTHCRVHISGLVAKLMPTHVVTIYSSKSDTPAFSALMNEFPLNVERSDLGGAFVDVEDEAGRRAIAVLFCRS